MADDSATVSGRAASAARQWQAEESRLIRGAIKRCRVFVATSRDRIDSSSRAIQERGCHAMDTASAHTAQVLHNASGVLKQFPETFVVGSTAVAYFTFLRRCPMRASGWLAASTFWLRKELEAKWLPEERMASLRRVRVEYHQQEHALLKDAMLAVRARLADATGAVQHMVSRAAHNNKVVCEQASLWRNKAVHNFKDGIVKFPELVAGGSAVLYGAAVGASNGTMLGNAPRRSLLVLAITSYAMRSQLAAKWSEDVLAVSAIASAHAESLATRYGYVVSRDEA